jgi:hypothetical protein
MLSKLILHYIKIIRLKIVQTKTNTIKKQNDFNNII